MKITNDDPLDVDLLVVQTFVEHVAAKVQQDPLALRWEIQERLRFAEEVFVNRIVDRFGILLPGEPLLPPLK